MLDLSYEVEQLRDRLDTAIAGVLESGQFILGPDVTALEQEFAQYIGVKHAIGLNSGTDALMIALRALGVESGDEVITTPFTFFATAEAVSNIGATPVFVDIDPDTFNMDHRLVEQKITPKTKAIIPVHIFGQSSDMDELLAIADKHGLKVLEDVAQATGAHYKHKKLGSIGGAGAFSFYPTKVLGGYGDGGMITTDDDEVAEMSRMLRVHGEKQRYHNEMLGYNSRLDSLQAAILRVKFPFLDEWIEQRKNVAHAYSRGLGKAPGIIVPKEDPDRDHVYHQYTIRIVGGNRDEVQRRLREIGVSSVVYYPVPVHKLPVYSETGVQLKIAEKTAGEVLSLPIWPQMSADTIDTVVNSVLRAVGDSH